MIQQGMMTAKDSEEIVSKLAVLLLLIDSTDSGRSEAAPYLSPKVTNCGNRFRKNRLRFAFCGQPSPTNPLFDPDTFKSSLDCR